LYAIEDVAVYGYITPLKVKIVLALALSDTVVRDVEIITVRFISYALSTDEITQDSQIFKALHMAFYSSISNPFLKLDTPNATNDQYPFLLVGSAKWKSFRRRVDEISRVVGAPTPFSHT
jgi:hypothetical protein